MLSAWSCHSGPVFCSPEKVKQKQVGQSRRSVVQLLFHILPELVHTMLPVKKCSGIIFKY